jgi:hypothetical protein
MANALACPKRRTAGDLRTEKSTAKGVTDRISDFSIEMMVYDYVHICYQTSQYMIFLHIWWYSPYMLQINVLPTSSGVFRWASDNPSHSNSCGYWPAKAEAKSIQSHKQSMVIKDWHQVGDENIPSSSGSFANFFGEDLVTWWWSKLLFANRDIVVNRCKKMVKPISWTIPSTNLKWGS